MDETMELLAAKFQAIFPHLDERQRRLLMGAEARAPSAQTVDGTRLDMGVDAPGSAYTPFGGGAERSGPLRPGALAAALGGTSVLLAASVLGLVLALAEKALCWSGAGNDYAQQFQRACYTDIYPLYYGEGLSAGKVPYTGHKVEYPVLIGGAMPARGLVGREGPAGGRGGGVLCAALGRHGARGGGGGGPPPRGRPPPPRGRGPGGGA